MNFFSARFGESPESGVSFPDYTAVARAYGLPACRITEVTEACPTLTALLADDTPALCEVMLEATQGFEPRVKSRVLADGRLFSPPLDDMYPFLDAEELADNRLS